MCAPHTVYTISPSPDSTLALEIKTTGLVKRKYLFVFQHFWGRLLYDPDAPLETVLNLTVETGSVVCENPLDKRDACRKLTQSACDSALSVKSYPQLHVASHRFSAKSLRGFVANSILTFRGTQRLLRANVGFGVEKKGRLQVEADALIQLSAFEIRQYTSHFGLTRTADEATVHALLWGTRQVV